MEGKPTYKLTKPIMNNRNKELTYHAFHSTVCAARLQSKDEVKALFSNPEVIQNLGDDHHIGATNAEIKEEIDRLIAEFN